MKKIILVFVIILAFVLTSFSEDKTLTQDQKKELLDFIELRLSDIDHDISLVFGTVKGIDELRYDKVRQYVTERLYQQCLEHYDESGKRPGQRISKVRTYLLTIRDIVPPLLDNYADRRNISKQKITDIRIKLKNENGIVPVISNKLLITLHTQNGETFKVPGDVSYSEFDIKMNGASFEDGYIYLDYSPLDSMKYTEVPYEITYKPDTKIKAKDSFPITYNSPVFINYPGRSGRNGDSGDSTIVSASTGKNGRDGGDGSDGEDGEEGPVLKVYFDLVEHPVTKEELIYTEVKNQTTGREISCIVSAVNGKLTIVASGGNGGNGGSGGDGQHGGMAPTGEGTVSGDGGDGGDGGNGGNGGRGGTIHIMNAPLKIKDYINSKVIILENYGGNSGWGGNAGRAGSAGSSPGKDQRKGRSGNSGYSGKNGNPGRHGPAIIYN